MLKERFAKCIQKFMAVYFTFVGLSGFSQVVINEFSASNVTTLQDNYNRYEDWIELYNTSGTAVDLGGYYLSDRFNNPTKWQIPAGVAIPANGYLIALASGKNEVSGGFLHTSFKITQTQQEYVVLADPSGSIIDYFWIEKSTQIDHSRGRTTDGAAQWSLFLTPTPGAANTAVPYQEYATRPEFNLAAGAYTGAVTVQLSAQPGNAIYYTLNGFEPTTASTLYTGPINIATTTVVRAIAVSPNATVPPSLVETNTYLMNETFTVPVVSVSGTEILTLLNGLQIEPRGHFEVFDEAGILVAEATGEYNKHGNDSWAYPQRGIDYIARDQYGYANALHHAIFPSKNQNEYQRIIMKAAASDNYPFENGGAHIRDAYVQSLSQVGGLDLDERTHQSCIMFANGEYWGVYEMREKVDDTDFTDHYYDQDEPYVDFLKTWGGTWVEYGQIQPWNTFRDYVLDPGTDITDPVVYQTVYDQFNTQSIIDYFIMNSFIVCSDWLNWNTGWWRGTQPGSPPVKWRYILWDMDASFDHYVNFTGVPDQSANADICDPEVLGNPGGQGHVPIWNKLLNNEDFLAEYIQRFADLINGPFDCDFMQTHLDSLVGTIAPEMPRHIDRWGGDMAEWEGNVQNIRDFIEVRCEMVTTSIVDCYEGVEGPYQLTVSAEPPEGGRVRVNTTLVDEFPWSGIYFGGLDLPLEAIARPGYEFSHWTIGNHIFDPSDESPQVSIMLTSNDTVVAHFAPSFYYDIVFKVNPDQGGRIVVNGDTLSNFPDTLSLPGIVANSIEAIGAPGYIFSHWTRTFTNTITPSMESANAELTLSFWGEVTAHFYPYDPEIIFNVLPEGTGTITIDEETISTYPDTRTLLGNSTYDLIAKPIDGFHAFDFWESINNPILPDIFDEEAEITFFSTDYIIAHFRELPSERITIDTRPRNAGRIILDYDTTLFDFPFSKRYLDTKSYAVEAIENEQYEFSHWELNYHSTISGSESPFLNFQLSVSDTLTAVFEERLPGIYIPSAFSPNGDGFNDIFFVKGTYLDAADFKMTIANRWGDVLFETTDILDGWRGEVMGTNYFAPVDVYVYKIRYRNTLTGESKEAFGNITLIR